MKLVGTPKDKLIKKPSWWPPNTYERNSDMKDLKSKLPMISTMIGFMRPAFHSIIEERDQRILRAMQKEGLV